MTRAILLVLDSFDLGATADAERFGNAGADTLGFATMDDGPRFLPSTLSSTPLSNATGGH